jgi:hypothetical protein
VDYLPTGDVTPEDDDTPQGSLQKPPLVRQKVRSGTKGEQNGVMKGLIKRRSKLMLTKERTRRAKEKEYNFKTYIQ